MRLTSRSLACLSAFLLLTGLSTVALASEPPPSSSMPDSGDLPVHYDIRASFDPHLRRISGTVEIFLTNRTASPVPRLSFLLYPNHYKERPPGYDEGRLDEIYSLGFSAGWIEVTDLTVHLSRTPDRGPIFIPRLRTSLAATVPLPRELAPGDSAAVRMRFTTQLPTKRGPFGFWKDLVTIQGGWHPILLPLDMPNPLPDLPPANASYRVALEMPNDWSAVLSGKMICTPNGTANIALKTSPRPLPGGEGQGEGVTCETLHEPGSTTSMALFKGRVHRLQTEARGVIVGNRLGEAALNRVAQRLAEAEEFLKSKLGTRVNQAPVTAVEGQLIQTLSSAGDGLLFLSPRLYQAFSWLHPFHDRDIVESYFEVRLRQIFPGRPAWANELISADLAESFFSEREITNLKDLAGPFAFVPIVDRLLYSPEIPLRGLYFGEQIGESKPEDIRTIGSRRLPGRILHQKLRDLLGAERTSQAIRHLLERRTAEPEMHEYLIRQLSADAGISLDEFFAQWLDRPTPSDYSLDPIVPPTADQPGRIELRRTPGPWEPLLVRARFPDRTIDWWLSGKDQTAVLALPPGEPPKWVQLDPDRRLSDPDIANNRQPMEWKTLLSRFGARYDFQSHEFEYNLSVLATPVHNRDRHLSLGLYRKEQSAGAKLEYRTDAWRSLVGNVHYELTGRIGWEKLRPEFGGESATAASNSLPLGFSIQRVRDGGGSIDLTAEGSHSRIGADFSYLKGVLTARRDWRLGPHESLATRLILGSGSNGLPDQLKHTLGGIDGARGFSKEELLGRNIVLATGEYRVPVHEDVGLSILGLLVVNRMQMVFFGDAGAVTDRMEDLARAGGLRYDLGLGFRLHGAWAGLMPAVLRLDAAYPVGPLGPSKESGRESPPRRRIHWYVSVGQSF